MHPDISAEKFKNDLLWTINSPAIMHLQAPHCTLPLSVQEEVNRWLQNHPVAAPNPNDISPRLGLYFEFLWKYIFENFPGFRLIAHNLQVQKSKQTLGAFDFIYYCEARQKYFHMETAVKFYLGVLDSIGQSAALNRWIGPGRQDRLDIKFNKMLSSQSQLSSTPEGRAAVEKLGIEDISPELTLKGRLFYPFQEDAEPPEHSASSHNIGYWLSHSQIQKLPPSGSWLLLDRHEWLTANAKTAIKRPELDAALSNAFSVHKFPVMLKHRPETKGANAKAEHYFLVPRDWASQLDCFD